MNSKEIKDIITLEKELAEYNGEDQVIHAQDLHRKLKEVSNSRSERVMRAPSFPTMNNLIKGFWGGELTIISGPTKMGKTTLCQTLTVDFAEQEKQGIWFTYEVPALQFLDYFPTIPGFYMPQQLRSNTLDWVYKRIYEAKLKFGIDYAFIDHLHYLIDMNRHNISLEIGHVMRFLKKLAISMNIHIFLVAHLEKVRLDTEPDETNLRDSSFVGQECDNCIMLWRLRNSDCNEAYVKIVLNRRFGVMGKKFIVRKIDEFLREVEEIHGDY